MQNRKWFAVAYNLIISCLAVLTMGPCLAAPTDGGLLVERDFSESTPQSPPAKMDFTSLGDQISVEAKILVTKYPTRPAALEIVGVPQMFSIALDPSGKLIASVNQQEFSNVCRLSSQGVVPLNTWVRAGLTYDGQVRRMALFLDGTMDSERDIVFFNSGAIGQSANPTLNTPSELDSDLKLSTVRIWGQSQLFNAHWKPRAFLGVHTLRYRKELLLAWSPSLVPPPLPAKLELTVSGVDGAVLVRRACTGKEALQGVTIPVSGLTTGDYQLRVSQTDAGGASTLAVNQPWHYTVPDTSLVNFRGDNVMTVKGKPFFPFGIYHVRSPDFGTIAGHGFNFVIADNADPTYFGPRQQEDYVEAAAKHGLMTLMRGFNILNPDGPQHARGKAELNKYQGDANVLAWYVDDEPKSFDTLVKSYEFAAREDPTHPAFMLHNQPPDFARTAVGGDIFSSDPYSFNVIPSIMIAEWTLAARQAVRDQKPVWTVLQLYTFTSNNPRVRPWSDLPSPEKLRAESYLALATGARGLIYYSFDDTYYKTERMRGVNLAKEFPREWASYRPVVQEIQNRAHIWTAPLAPVEVRNQAKEVFVSERPYEADGYWWVLAVNPSRTQAAEARFSLTSGKLREVADALGHAVPNVTRTTIKERIEPHGVRLYRIVPAGR